MVSRAMEMIHVALWPLIRKGIAIHRIKLFVSPASGLADAGTIETHYGTLKVSINEYATKGAAYLMEDPTGRKGRGFAWVSRPPIKKMNRWMVLDDHHNDWPNCISGGVGLAPTTEGKTGRTGRTEWYVEMVK